MLDVLVGSIRSSNSVILLDKRSLVFLWSVSSLKYNVTEIPEAVKLVVQTKLRFARMFTPKVALDERPA